MRGLTTNKPRLCPHQDAPSPASYSAGVYFGQNLSVQVSGRCPRPPEPPSDDQSVLLIFKGLHGLHHLPTVSPHEIKAELLADPLHRPILLKNVGGDAIEALVFAHLYEPL